MIILIAIVRKIVAIINKKVYLRGIYCEEARCSVYFYFLDLAWDNFLHGWWNSADRERQPYNRCKHISGDSESRDIHKHIVGDIKCNQRDTGLLQSH